MAAPIRLLSIGHSYSVALNRRLTNEIARVGKGRWEVATAAPEFVAGDLRPVPLEREAGELAALEPVPAHLTSRMHFMFYGQRLRELLRQPWNLVHCWEEPYIAAGGQIAWWANPKSAFIFYTFQNLSKTYPPPFRWIEQYVLGRANAWIAAGESVLASRLQSGYGSKPSIVLPLGVDLAHFAPNRSAGATVLEALGWTSGGAPVLGYLGRFVEEKGLRLLMRTLDSLRQPWRMLLVGAGPLEGVLREWAAANPDRVRVVTGVKHGDVPAYLNAMDLLCAPSQTTSFWCEQLGRMLIEAFAAGVPVIASDSGEIPYVVGTAGKIVGESDEAGWRSGLGELLENPALRAGYAAEGLERAQRDYAWPVIARRHVEFFEKVLG